MSRTRWVFVIVIIVTIIVCSRIASQDQQAEPAGVTSAPPEQSTEPAVPTATTVPAGPSDEDILRQELAYLSDKEILPEISWVEFEENNVYIGFNTVPSELSSIVGGAAFRGNKAINFGVHVWAVDAKYTGWRPGDQGLICEATARHGKNEDNSCG